MRTAEHTIEVRADAIPYDDWRKDPRWEQLMDYALELFGEAFVCAHGRLLQDGDGVEGRTPISTPKGYLWPCGCQQDAEHDPGGEGVGVVALCRHHWNEHTGEASA